MRIASHGAPPRPTRYFINSIAKALRVLEAFSGDHRHLTLTELSERSLENKATTRRVALTLRDLGYLRQDTVKRFALTPKVLDLGERFLEALSLPDVAEPHLAELAGRIRESTNVAIRDGRDALYVARVTAADRILDVNLRIGSRLPLHATSLGKALLLEYSREELIEALGPPPWPNLTGATRTDPDRLMADLAEAQRVGCAMADGELEIGLRSIAAPIRDASGAIVAAVNISTHTLRVPLDTLLSEMRPALIETAGEISADLGYRPQTAS